MDWAFSPETAIDWIRAVCLWTQVAIAAWVLRRAGWLTMPFRGRKSMNTMGLSNADIWEFRYLAAFVILTDIAAVAVIATDLAVPVDLILWGFVLFLIVKRCRSWRNSRPKFNPKRFGAYALGPLGAAGLAGLGLLVSTVYHGAPMAGRIARAASGVSDTQISMTAQSKFAEVGEAMPKIADTWAKTVSVCIGEGRSFCLEVAGNSVAAINAAKGRLGEHITRTYAMGFTSKYGKPDLLPSKLPGDTGLDHVVVVRDRHGSGRIDRLYLIETKTFSRTLSLSSARGGHQFSDEWLDSVLSQMAGSADEKIRNTAAIIRAKLADDPTTVHRELWWQNLENGVMKRQSVGPDGSLRGSWDEIGKPEYVLGKIRLHCRAGNGTVSWSGLPAGVQIRCPPGSQASPLMKPGASAGEVSLNVRQ